MTLLLIDEVIEKLVVEVLSPKLKQLGFDLIAKKRSFQKKKDNCKLELNVQVRKIPGQNVVYVEICPGIIYDELEKLTAKLKGEKLRKGWPTAAANLGNLKPNREFMEWQLTNTIDMLTLGKVIFYNINEYAVPFWEQFSTIEGLIDGYEKEDLRLILTGNNYKWRMVAAYCLTGRKADAISVLEKWEKGRPSQDMIDHAYSIILKMC